MNAGKRTAFVIRKVISNKIEDSVKSIFRLFTRPSKLVLPDFFLMMWEERRRKGYGKKIHKIAPDVGLSARHIQRRIIEIRADGYNAADRPTDKQDVDLFLFWRSSEMISSRFNVYCLSSI